MKNISPIVPPDPWNIMLAMTYDRVDMNIINNILKYQEQEMAHAKFGSLPPTSKKVAIDLGKGPLEHCQKIIERKTNKRVSILDVGVGSGLFGRLARATLGDGVGVLDGVEIWPGNLIFQQALYYDHIFVEDIRDQVNALGVYDLVFLDGLYHYLPTLDLLCLISRLQYNGDVIVSTQDEVQNYSRNPLDPLDHLPPVSLLVQIGGEEIEGGCYLFKKKEGKAATVLIRTFERPFMVRASIESLLKSWLPPSEVILVDDGSDDGRLRAYLENLSLGVHKKNLLTMKHSGELYLSAQRGIDLFHKTEEKEFLVFCDSDFRYNRKWFQIAAGGFHFLSKRYPDLNPGMCTAFHLGAEDHMHGYEETRMTPWGHFCLRESSGWGNLLVKDSIAREITAIDPERRDSGYVAQVRDMGYSLVGTIPSYVQHVGAKASTMEHFIGDFAPDYSD